MNKTCAQIDSPDSTGAKSDVYNCLVVFILLYYVIIKHSFMHILTFKVYVLLVVSNYLGLI